MAREGGFAAVEIVIGSGHFDLGRTLDAGQDGRPALRNGGRYRLIHRTPLGRGGVEKFSAGRLVRRGENAPAAAKSDPGGGEDAVFHGVLAAGYALGFFDNGEEKTGQGPGWDC